MDGEDFEANHVLKQEFDHMTEKIDKNFEYENLQMAPWVKKRYKEEFLLIQTMFEVVKKKDSDDWDFGFGLERKIGQKYTTTRSVHVNQDDKDKNRFGRKTMAPHNTSKNGYDNYQSTFD